MYLHMAHFDHDNYNPLGLVTTYLCEYCEGEFVTSEDHTAHMKNNHCADCYEAQVDFTCNFERNTRRT